MTALQSKKFIGFLLAELTWKIAILVSLIMGYSVSTVLAMILVVGFLEVAYIASQAALDRYVRVAEIAAKGGNE